MDIPESLQIVIDEWESLKYPPINKNYIPAKSPFDEKELMITFRISAQIKSGYQSSPIWVEKRFFTFTLKDENANHNVDDHNLKVMLDHLDSCFQSKIDGIVSRSTHNTNL